MNDIALSSIKRLRSTLGILDSTSNKTQLYWAGLLVIIASSIVFFGTVWYSLNPLFDYYPYSYGNEPGDSRVARNLSNAMPFLVGSIVFIVFGTHMALSGRK
jgi:hypothetical protein